MKRRHREEPLYTGHGDGLAVKELDRLNRQAERDPRGPKEFWRQEMVGKYTYGADSHLMTDAEFEADWLEGDD